MGKDLIVKSNQVKKSSFSQGASQFISILTMSWNQWHSGQSSWPSWGQDWSSHGGWQAPSTPPRKPSKQHVKDSPQGSAESNLGLAASFQPTREFYYAQEIFGMNFPRKTQASACATKHGFAGRSLEEIRLHELSWQGWQNYNLRALAQGRYVSINFTRSIKAFSICVNRSWT